jgi:hypothetical protein
VKNKTGLFIAILGIIILGITIGYQAKTETSALFMIPIGLGVTFLGVFMLIRSNIIK